MRATLIGSALVATSAVTLFQSGATTRHSQQVAGQSGPLVIRVREAGVRNDPRETADTVGRVVFGEPVVTLDRREDWFRIRSESTGVMGWVHRYATYPRAQQSSLIGRPVPTGVVLITDIAAPPRRSLEYAYTRSGYVLFQSVAGSAGGVMAIRVGSDLQPALLIQPGQALVFAEDVRLPARPFSITVTRAQGATLRVQEAIIRRARNGVLYYLSEQGVFVELPH